MILTRDLIVESGGLDRELVPVSEWVAGGEVYVRALSGEEAESLFKGAKDAGCTQYDIAAACVCDDKGELLFGDDGSTIIAGKHWKATKRVFDVACRLNGIGEQEAKSIEEKSEGTPDADSGSS